MTIKQLTMAMRISAIGITVCLIALFVIAIKLLII